jgi:hypothetical protein
MRAVLVRFNNPGNRNKLMTYHFETQNRAQSFADNCKKSGITVLEIKEVENKTLNNAQLYATRQKYHPTSN